MGCMLKEFIWVAFLKNLYGLHFERVYMGCIWKAFKYGLHFERVYMGCILKEFVWPAF